MPCHAGFYVHPAMADCTLHLSLVPNNSSKELLAISIPVSLGALAILGRRDGLLRAPWAAAASNSVPGAAAITGNMTIVASPNAKEVAPASLHFVGLSSKAISTADRSHESQQAAARQVYFRHVRVA